MRIAVTGSKGFIGKHLVRELRNRYFDVIELDREDFNNISKINDINILFHLGVNVPFSDYEYNIESVKEDSQNLIWLLLLQNIKKIIYPSVIVQNKHNNLYAYSKEMCEDLILNNYKRCNKEFVIIRFPTIYGPGQRPKGFIYKHMNTPKGIKPPYIFIDDAVEALIKAIDEKNQLYEFKKGKTPLIEGLKKLRICTNNPIYIDLDGTIMDITYHNMPFFETWENIKDDKPFKFSISILKKLRKKHSLILITARRDRKLLIKQLKKLGLFKYFDEIINTEKQPKSKFIKYDNGVIIGDTEDDIEAGLSHNLKTFAVLSGARTKEQLKKYKGIKILNNLKEVLKYV